MPSSDWLGTLGRVHALNALLLASSLVPLALMVAALAYVAWTRQGAQEAPADARSAKAD